jgi:hypothetical protein
MRASRRLSKSDTARLRRQLQDLGYGQAETEAAGSFAARFFPVLEHLRAVEPGVVLIVGPRGAGKTALFRAFFEHGDVIRSVVRRAGAQRRLPDPAEKATWIPAQPIGSQFPDSRALREITTDAKARDFWYAMLVRRLKGQILPEHESDLTRLMEASPTAVGEILRLTEQAGARPTEALDALQRHLDSEREFIFLGYDELDTLGAYDWALMARLVTGLIGLWSEYSRRWPRIRPKIFLRSDLFQRHSGMGSADLAKLAANRAELTWSDAALLGMLIKRIANTSEDLAAYCQARASKLQFDEDPVLGLLPRVWRPEEAHPFIERMAGEFMGGSRKKGYVKNWILDHLRDGNRRVAPRTLVRLVEQAARKDGVNSGVRPPRLLHPAALRQALEDVSTEHVAQAITSEWPWLWGVRRRLQQQPLTPWRRAEVERLLRKNGGESWGPPDAPMVRPPEEDGRALVRYLVELGVFRERTDGRIDVPDIYLFGLGLRRKGGVSVGKPRRRRRVRR